MKEVLLARLPRSFDILDDTDLHSPAQRADGHAEGGRRFALAAAGVDDQQSALHRAACLHSLACDLYPLHAGVVAGEVFWRLGHCVLPVVFQAAFHVASASSSLVQSLSSRGNPIRSQPGA